MSVLEEILTWTKSKSAPPPWMSDALRRIVLEGAISPDGIIELTHLCKKPYGLAEGGSDVIPIAEEHLRERGLTGAVTLKSVTHVSDVNALEPGQVLPFRVNGLTVIYGDNGAGKSGYARILKRACRARGSGTPVLPNALSEKPGGTPTARIKVVCADTETEHVWRDGNPSSSQLSAISVFDAAAASVYIADRTEVRFRPFGLDVLDSLANACQAVRERLVSEANVLKGRGPRWPVVPPDTAAGRFLPTITALTSVESIDRVAKLTTDEDAERQRLLEVIAAAKADDPTKRAKELTLQGQRIGELLAGLRQLQEKLGAAGAAALQAARLDHREKGARASALEQRTRESALLPGLLSEAWKRLWAGAREYSTREAYRGHAFPHVGDDARCVLCQQEMSPPARERLSVWQASLESDAQRAATVAKEHFEGLLAAIERLQPGQLFPHVREELVAIDPETASAVEQFVAACDEGLRAFQRGEDGSVNATFPDAALTRIAEDLKRRATDLLKAADPAARQIAERRLAELQAKKALSDIRPTIDAEVERLARINAYERCCRDADTRPITVLSTELTKRHVTSVLTGAFEEELKKLGFKHPQLELRAVGGARGVLYHQVQLKHVTRAELPTVVSEGEARCVSLAAFFAELRTAGDMSGIVFDDPVSSLDNRWRTAVAERLASEAAQRQVVVFTHDLVFLFALIQAAERMAQPYQTQWLHRVNAGTGHVEDELPWAASNTQRRIGWLKNAWQEAEKVHRTQGAAAYEPLAARLYARLRQTWERAVEEVLINGAVERFKPGIETKRLARLCLIKPDDIKTIEDGMTKTSRWEGGHDHAAAAGEPFPEPEAVKKDIDTLEGWVKEYGTRKR